MSRTTTNTIAVTETLVASRCTIRRSADGTGSVEFFGTRQLTGPGGEDMGVIEATTRRAEFSDLADVDFEVADDAGPVRLKGRVVLAALDEMYDYLRTPANPPPDPPLE